MKQLWSPWRSQYVETLRSDTKGCEFCNITESADDDEVFIVFRGEHNFVVMNIYPYNNGHLLIVPHQHVAELTELPNDVLQDATKLVQLSSKVLGNVFNPHGFNVGLNIGEAAGAGIAEHIHFHIVPRWKGDTNFMPVLGETKLLSSDLKKGFKKIKSEFERLTS